MNPALLNIPIPVLKTQSELIAWRHQQTSSVSFVPTMGGLHDGHRKLIEASKNNSEDPSSICLVSIFVNPLQFDDDNDFSNYPKELAKDIKFALNSGANAIWAPSVEDVFPGGAKEHFQIKVPLKLQEHLCGKYRKGHFDGVATVIIQLLSKVKPKYLFLGEKDWQQLIIIKKLIASLDLPVKVIGVATEREQDGLANSTRNKYLDKSTRKKVIALPNELKKASKDMQNGKYIDLNSIKFALEENGLEVEYLELVDPYNLQPKKPDEKLSLLAAAIRCCGTRLIDHTFIMKRNPIVAIDGPAGAGKSTVTKAFAKKMGLLYLDTGAMYRAVAWLIKKEKINPNEAKDVEKAIQDINLKLKNNKKGDKAEVFINGFDVSEAIRSPEVTSIVSQVAAHACVRESLTKQQKDMGISGGLVAEGRDIGTAVFPDAELKIFLTATPTERARRRIIDLKQQGYELPTLEALKNEIEERDYLDSNRKISPLIKAEDATEIITDGMNIEEVVNSIYDLFQMKVPSSVWSKMN